MSKIDNPSGRDQSSKQQPIHVSGVQYSSPVGKRIAYVDGKVVKTSILEARATAGRAINKVFATAEEAFHFRATLDATCMLFTGTFGDTICDGDAILVPDKAIPRYQAQFEAGDAPDIVSATKKYLDFRPGGGLLPIDIDTKGREEVCALWPDEEPLRFKTPQEVRDAILDVLPEASEAPMMVAASSSSMIIDTKTKELIKGPGGWRVYVALDDASRIPDILEAVHQRCWARGVHRYAFISKGGAFLQRSIADQALARPTQPDYPQADLGKGLRKAKGATATWNVDGAFLVAASVKVDVATRSFAKAEIEAAKHELKPDAEKITTRRKREHVDVLVKKGVQKAAAERSAAKRFEAGILTGSDIVVFEDDTEISVAELLDRGEKFDGKICLDPVEPEYDGGRAVGKFYWNKGLCAAVHSFAHGSKTYWLKHDTISVAEVVKTALETQPADYQAIIRALALADMTDIENDMLEKAAAKGLGLGNKVSSIRTGVATFRDQAREYLRSLGGDGASDEEDLFILPDEPLEVARIYRDTQLVENMSSLLYWRDGWWSWSGRHWNALPADAVTDDLYDFTGPAWKMGKHGPEPWNPNRSRIGDVLEALRGLVRLDDAVEPLSWLDGREDGGKPVAVANGLLDVRTRRLTAHTPFFFNLNSVPFAYDPDAKCKAFDAFVASLWDEDDGARRTLVQMLGYLVSGRTDMHCVFGLIGKKRGGKSTIARLATELLGPANVVNLTVEDFSYTFGLETTIGKSLAVLADVRTTGKNNSTLVQRLLSITGEDGIPIQRKNRKGLSTRTLLRLMYLSNETPYFGDASTAAAKRFVLMIFDRDFSGREDRQLGDKLSQELPGILNAALDGLAELEREGQFTQSAAAEAESEDMADLSSPIRVFVREECELGVDFQVEKKQVYWRWKTWCEGHGMPPRSEPLFASRLYAAYGREVRAKRGRQGDDRMQLYVGIRLREWSHCSTTGGGFTSFKVFNGGVDPEEAEEVVMPMHGRRRRDADEGGSEPL
jgi:putative DNA primase/helicase